LVIVDRTHAACGSGMQAASTAISPLGFELDLMLHKILTRMRKRSTVWSGGASTCLAGAGAWMGARGRKTVARELRRRESDDDGSESDRRKMKGEWGLPRLGPPYFLGGPPNLPIAIPSAVQHTSTTIFREVCTKIKADFLLTDYNYDLNLSLGLQLNKKTPSGRPDGKHVLQAPTSYLFRSLTNHFVKSTKYMTEDSEHYMDRSKVHKSPATSLDPEPDTQNRHTTSPGPPRAVTMTYFAKAEHVVRLLLAPGA
jgi:hypothetical protein